MTYTIKATHRTRVAAVGVQCTPPSKQVPFALCVCATGMRSRRRADGSPWIIIINTLAAGFHSNSPRIGEVPPRASSSPFLFPFPLGVGTCVPSTLGALGRARLPLTKYRHRTERPWDHNDHDR